MASVESSSVPTAVRLAPPRVIGGVGGLVFVTPVVVPATLPSILVALRLPAAQAWTAVRAAEPAGAPNRRGYAVSWYRDMLITPRVIAFIGLVGLSGYVCDLALRRLGAGLTPWAPRPELFQ